MTFAISSGTLRKDSRTMSFLSLINIYDLFENILIYWKDNKKTVAIDLWRKDFNQLADLKFDFQFRYDVIPEIVTADVEWSIDVITALRFLTNILLYKETHL